MKSPIRWAGSKKKLLPKLANYWAGEGNYLEAFAGSAALFFHLEPTSGALNDLNEELIHAYSILRRHPRRLHNILQQLPVSKRKYDQLRGQDPENLGILERAARFFYLNRYCFNGIYRTNLKGRFNVPFAGATGTGSFPSYDQWYEHAQLLSSVALTSQDFDAFVRDRAVRGDFVYLDPPYAVANRRIFSQYSAQTFGSRDIERLASLMSYIDRIGATFLVSYAKSPEAKVLAEGWYVESTFTQRNVAGFSEHRRKAGEILISNVWPNKE